MNEPPTFPAYRAIPVAACPECLATCDYEGADGWWCRSCQHMWTTQQVAYYDEGEPLD